MSILSMFKSVYTLEYCMYIYIYIYKFIEVRGSIHVVIYSLWHRNARLSCTRLTSAILIGCTV